MPRFKAVTSSILSQLQGSVCKQLPASQGSKTDKGCAYQEGDIYSEWIEYKIQESGESTNWYFAMGDFAYSYGEDSS